MAYDVDVDGLECLPAVSIVSIGSAFLSAGYSAAHIWYAAVLAKHCTTLFKKPVFPRFGMPITECIMFRKLLWFFYYVL